MLRSRTEVLLMVVILLAHLYAVVLPADSLMNWFGSDDAFYYFKTAQNAAEGRGLTFDGLGHDSGFHPLWMAICVPVFALARFDLILPLRMIAAISSLLGAATALVLYRLAKRFIDPRAAALAALLWVFIPYIHHNVIEMGLESAVSGFFIALLLYRLAAWRMDDARPDDRSMLLTGLIAALAVLARLDNIFLVAVLGAWMVVRPARARVLLITDVALISFGVLWSYFARIGFGPQYAQYLASEYALLAVALVVRMGAAYLLGLYDRRLTPDYAGTQDYLRLALRCGLVWVISTALVVGIQWVLARSGVFTAFPRSVHLYEAGFALAALLVTRFAAALVERMPGAASAEPVCWGPTLRRGVTFALPLGLILAAYMGANLWYFGTPSPVSGQVKRWWGSLPNTVYGRPAQDLSGLLGIQMKNAPWSLILNITPFPKNGSQPVRALIYGLPALALVVAQRRRAAEAFRQLALYPLLVGCLVQILSYTGTGYLHVRAWYWVAQMMLIVLLLGILLDALLCVLARPVPGWASMRRAAALAVQAAPLLAGVLIAGVGTYDIANRMPFFVSEPKAERYLIGARELEANTEPGAVIGSTGGGVIAYFVKERTIVNMDGLMNTKAYFEALQKGTARDYLDNLGMSYVYASAYMVTSSDPYFQLKGRLEPVKQFGGSMLFRWVK